MPSATPPSTSSQAPVPLAKFLESAGVSGEPIAPDKLTDLTVTMPRPKGWALLVGIALGTVFRFVTYRRWVWAAKAETEPAEASPRGDLVRGR